MQLSGKKNIGSVGVGMASEVSLQVKKQICFGTQEVWGPLLHLSHTPPLPPKNPGETLCTSPNKRVIQKM